MKTKQKEIPPIFLNFDNPKLAYWSKDIECATIFKDLDTAENVNIKFSGIVQYASKHPEYSKKNVKSCIIIKYKL